MPKMLKGNILHYDYILGKTIVVSFNEQRFCKRKRTCVRIRG